MKIYRADNTCVLGTRWIIASSATEARKIGLSLNMVRDPRNLEITEMNEQDFPDTDIKEVKCSGLGQLHLSKQGRREWMVYDTSPTCLKNRYKVLKYVDIN